jgi:hypothetical protein
MSGHFWPPTKDTGARRGSSGDLPPVDPANNPFKLGLGFNLTEQGQLLQSSPAIAKRLQETALEK